METAAYQAWLADHLNGQDSLLIARTTQQAAELSRRARADLAALGLVRGDGVTLADGNTAGATTATSATPPAGRPPTNSPATTRRNC